MVLWLALATPASAQEGAHLAQSVGPANEFVLAIDPAFHAQYGCRYPMTYRFRIPPGSSGMVVERRRTSSAPWDTLPEKSSDDYFNGIEAVRFDSPGGHAHVSAAFAPESDSLYLRILDETGTPVIPRFEKIDPYYDDRRAAVTVSADDWCDNEAHAFCATLDVFRSFGLYVTCGVITSPAWTSDSTWTAIQGEVDSGYVEVASHSRTHTDTPYADPAGEVQGSADDIVSHLHLPAPFAAGDRQYVYVWIAPFGSYDHKVDSLVGSRSYLVPRLYNHLGQVTLSDWANSHGHFGPIQATMEIGLPPWGGGSLDSLRMDGAFDSAVAQGDVYHLMWHPQGAGWALDDPSVLGHLRYISGRPDVWYANLGLVYLYHLIESANRFVSTELSVNGQVADALRLHPNYPNPFGRATTIGFDLPERSQVSVRIFDLLGRRIATLVDGPMPAGRHVVSWDARKAEGGTYFCQLVASPLAGGGMRTSTRKLLLVR